MGAGNICHRRRNSFSASRPYALNFPDSLTGQSFIAFLVVATPCLGNDGAKISIFFESRSIVS